MEQLPTLITFDGDARSGKGTIVSLVKDYLRDERGRRVMLIDAGQIFRVLVVVCREAGVDLDSQDQIDAYLADETRQTEAIARVKQVYRMPKADRETLLYSPTIGVDSAKIGARPLSQDFKDGFLRKWLRDARAEGFDTRREPTSPSARPSSSTVSNPSMRASRSHLRSRSSLKLWLRGRAPILALLVLISGV
jgi:hypothetical protein